MKKIAAVLITGMIVVGTSLAVFAAPSPLSVTDETIIYTDIYGNPIPLAALDSKEMPITVITEEEVAKSRYISPKTGPGLLAPALSLLTGASAAGIVWIGLKTLHENRKKSLIS